ncbi:MAG: PSP1 domain-containing protein [Planctomycetaceae bacterium]|nr:PSP1 domain-containing protein [Planctomycetaceae bacterium]
MLGQHWVRHGVLGSVGRFAAVDAQRYARGARVICRTQRGLEVGEVLAALDDLAESKARHEPADGSLLRRVTVEDDLLLARLERNREQAYRACEERLIERRIPAVLVDVEHLFDGQSLLFYFLGETTPELDALTTELAEVYEAQVQFRKFTETLTAGCGPGCGTDEAEHGCASGACSTCAVVTACGSKKDRRRDGGTERRRDSVTE